jgi:hypothetical protein
VRGWIDEVEPKPEVCRLDSRSGSERGRSSEAVPESARFGESCVKVPGFRETEEDILRFVQVTDAAVP